MKEKYTYLQLSGQSHCWDVYWLRVVAVTGIISSLKMENTEYIVEQLLS